MTGSGIHAPGWKVTADSQVRGVLLKGSQRFDVSLVYVRVRSISNKNCNCSIHNSNVRLLLIINGLCLCNGLELQILPSALIWVLCCNQLRWPQTVFLLCPYDLYRTIAGIVYRASLNLANFDTYCAERQQPEKRHHS